MSTNKIILDHIDNIYIDQTFPIKNLHALNYTAEGIHALAHIVRQEEINFFIEEKGTPPDIMMMGLKNQNILMNHFNWFSISIINYVRLVGFIDIVNKNSFTREQIIETDNHRLIKNYCKEYIKNVIPEIYTYRNKLSAHYSLTDPFRDDNIATLESSVMNSIVYRDYHYEGGGLIWGAGEDLTEIKPWKLTQIYEDLCIRYWPSIRLPKLPNKEDII